MKNLLFSLVFIFSTTISTQSQAATGWGCDANVFGPVTYTYVSGDAIFTIINGLGCMVTDINDQAMIASAVTVLTTAQASGKSAKLYFDATSVSAVLNQ